VDRGRVVTTAQINISAGGQAAGAANLRQIALLSLDYFLRYVDQVRAGFGGDALKGLIFVALVQGNIGHIDRDKDQSGRWSDVGDVPPDDLRRPIRILPLADSLRLPRESVRRKMQMLAADGFVIKTPKGFIAPSAVLSRPGNARALAGNAAMLGGLIDGLGALGAAGLGPKAGGFRAPTSHHRLLGRITSDFILRCLDEIRMLFDGEVLTGMIFLAVAAANFESFSHGSEPMMAGAPRQPVSVQTLAGRIGLPRETVRRHVRRLIDLDLCQTAGAGSRAGLVVPPGVIERPAFLATAQRNEVNVRWLVAQLRRSGVLPPA
jgi:DNA-binding Lrp family transcriptional regulator